MLELTKPGHVREMRTFGFIAKLKKKNGFRIYTLSCNRHFCMHGAAKLSFINKFQVTNIAYRALNSKKGKPPLLCDNQYIHE